jgi:hypothetical protein
MATAGKIYTGPDFALWRRLVLHHAWHFVGALMALWVLLMMEEVYNTERHLLYVACTRARDRLFISGVELCSEFLSDLMD